MKRIFIILIILFICINISACSENPYSGQYMSTNNIIIKLDSNNNCTIIDTIYKEAFYAEGKYTINNNNIDISFSKSDYCGEKSLKGKFEGSSIEIYDALYNKYVIYYKE